MQAHLFRAQVGVPVKDFLRRIRIEVTKHLLQDSGLTLDHIAQAAGFWDAAHLSRVFQQYAACAPGAYRTVLATQVSSATAAGTYKKSAVPCIDRCRPAVRYQAV